MWYEVKDNKHHVNYPESTAKLMISVLNASNTFIQQNTCLREVARELKGLPSEVKQELKILESFWRVVPDLLVE